MRQRVGIARALAMQPRLLLLDEPFGALDALTRANLQDELMRIVAETGSTVLMVTHDVDLAVLLSERSVMLTKDPAATIGEILALPLAHPRERLALAHDAEYIDCRSAVLEFLYQKQRKNAAGWFGAIRATPYCTAMVRCSTGGHSDGAPCIHDQRWSPRGALDQGASWPRAGDIGHAWWRHQRRFAQVLARRLHLPTQAP